MTTKKSLVIVGGGFGGLSLVNSLSNQLPANWDLVLISEESYTTFNPMLAEAVGASIMPEHVIAPLREVIRPNENRRFIMGMVSNIDIATQKVDCDTLIGAMAVPYDGLVLAYGNRARTDFIPGLADHALPLKTIGDALEIRNQLLRRLARIELETDSRERRLLGSFIIIGGGFSGVEVAGEAVDFVKGILPYYPNVKMDEISFTLVQDLGKLLPELPEKLGDAAKASLEKRGVKVMLNARAKALNGEGVVLQDERRIDGRTMICTIGTKPNEISDRLCATLELTLERGQLPVNPDMRIQSARDQSELGIWALGDCAAVVNAKNNTVSPPTAQFAVQQGAHLAKNIKAVLAGSSVSAFRYSPKGSMAAMGHMNGIADIFGFALSGLPAWLLWRAYYLLLMPTLGRKVRIFVEWTWGMFFPPDITHFRYRRSKEL
jgi:NADH dehydrogenase